MGNSLSMHIFNSDQNLSENICSDSLSIVSEFLQNIEHLLALSELHDGINLLGEIVHIDFEHFDDIFVMQFAVVLIFLDDLNSQSK